MSAGVASGKALVSAGVASGRALALAGRRMRAVAGLALASAMGLAFAAQGAAVPGSESYVQDGLVLHWDGIDNTLQNGVRSHAAAPTKWCDLSGQGNDVTIPTKFVTVEANAMLSAANTNKKPDTNTTATVTYPTFKTLNGLACGTNDAPFTVEVVAQRVRWAYTDNYANLQSIFTTPRGGIGYRFVDSDGFYFLYPGSKTQLVLMNWYTGKAASDGHTISVVFGNAQSTSARCLDAGASVAPSSNDSFTAVWGRFGVFSNLRTDIRIHAIRVYARTLTAYERERNYLLDQARFFGKTETPFLVQPIPDQLFDAAKPSTPEPVVADPRTDQPLVKGTDYTVAYAHNDRFGTATATITGQGAWAGRTKTVSFLICPADLYRDVAYIESSGTQVINTGYYPNPTTKMEASIQFVGDSADRSVTAPVTAAGPIFFGSQEGGGTAYFSMNFGGGDTEDNRLYAWFDKGSKYGSKVMRFDITTALRTTRQTFTCNAANGAGTYGTVTFTGLKKTTTHTKYPLHIFGTIGAGGLVKPFTYYKMRVYGWKIWDGDVLKRDFVPCYRTFDLKAGLRDRVSGRFYPSDGPGDFTYDVGTYSADLPEGYQQLDYLCATGGQAIATGVTAARDVTALVEFLPFTATKLQRILGSRTKAEGEMTASDLFFEVWMNSSQKWACCCADGPSAAEDKAGMWSASTVGYSLSRKTFLLDSWGDGFYVNGTKAVTLSAPRYGAGGEITLLRAIPTGTRGRGRVYSACIWKAGEIVRKFVPCYRTADARTGLYDLVNGTFHPSEDPNPALHGTGGTVGVPYFGGEVAQASLRSDRVYPNLTNFSFTAWVKNPNVGSQTYGVIVSQGALGTQCPGFCCYTMRGDDGSQSIQFQLRNSAASDSSTILRVDNSVMHNDNKWHQIACTYDGSSAVAYLDGKAVAATNSVKYVVAKHDSPFCIGARMLGYTSGYPMRGQVSQVTLWNRALTADEVGHLRSHPATGTEKGLVDAWTLDSGEAGVTGLVTKRVLYFWAGDFGFVDDPVEWFVPGMILILR
ncbi:MAG: LamG domain-containing protein [Kiritimatiellia bacterium]